MTEKVSAPIERTLERVLAQRGYVLRPRNYEGDNFTRSHQFYWFIRTCRGRDIELNYALINHDEHTSENSPARVNEVIRTGNYWGESIKVVLGKDRGNIPLFRIGFPLQGRPELTPQTISYITDINQAAEQFDFSRQRIAVRKHAQDLMMVFSREASDVYRLMDSVNSGSANPEVVVRKVVSFFDRHGLHS